MRYELINSAVRAHFVVLCLALVADKAARGNLSFVIAYAVKILFAEALVIRSAGRKAFLAEMPLLSNKPVIYACNMSEGDFENGIENNARFNAVKAIAATEGAETLPICAEMEAQIASLSVEEKELFLADLGLEKSGLDRLIKTCYDLLGLISYLTAGKPEVRAWTIQKGTKAPGAAGKIHTDFERGFIRAEVVAFNDLMSSGSMTAAKEKGLVRSEGKEYVMQDFLSSAVK